MVDCNREVLNDYETLDRFKHFIKWTLPVRRQYKNLYVRNLVLKIKMRCMKRSLARAWRLVRKYKEAVGVPPIGNVPMPRPKVQL